jgi:hypothetical protein
MQGKQHREKQQIEDDEKGFLMAERNEIRRG